MEGMEPSSSAQLCCLLAGAGRAVPCQTEGPCHKQLVSFGSILAGEKSQQRAALASLSPGSIPWGLPTLQGLGQSTAGVMCQSQVEGTASTPALKRALLADTASLHCTIPGLPSALPARWELLCCAAAHW